MKVLKVKKNPSAKFREYLRDDDLEFVRDVAKHHVKQGYTVKITEEIEHDVDPTQENQAQ
jgi:hypothetical protein